MKSKLPEGWKDVELREVFSYKSGLSKGRKYFGTGYPYLSFKEIFYNYFVPENLSELVETTEKERDSMSIKKGDVFLTRTSETFDELGMSSVALKSYKNATFNGFAKRLRPRIEGILYPSFSGYYFRSKRFRNQVDSISTMTTRASLNNSMLDMLKIIIPPYEEQEAIADTLSALDDKIELNNKVNKNLEQQTQAIFKHWFIDFEFPDENGNPYKSSGGEMVESELGMIPIGWEVGEIARYFDIAIGRTPPRKKTFYFSDKKEDTTWVSISDLGKSGVFISESKEKLTDKAFEDFNIRTVPKNSVLMSFKLTIGRVAITNKELTTNEAIAHFVSKEIYMIQYLYLYLKVFEFQKLGNTSSIGTAINSTIVKKMPFLNPGKKSLDTFNKTIDIIFEKIRNLEAQNQRLSQLRDALLPKLMSGEIRVPLD